MLECKNGFFQERKFNFLAIDASFLVLLNTARNDKGVRNTTGDFKSNNNDTKVKHILIQIVKRV